MKDVEQHEKQNMLNESQFGLCSLKSYLLNFAVKDVEQHGKQKMLNGSQFDRTSRQINRAGGQPMNECSEI